jgi:hypothetical protein
MVVKATEWALKEMNRCLLKLSGRRHGAYTVTLLRMILVFSGMVPAIGG